jgi:hypothetical protein
MSWFGALSGLIAAKQKVRFLLGGLLVGVATSRFAPSALSG